MISEQDRLLVWTKQLNLAGFVVVHERRDTPADPVRFTVRPKDLLACCPHCREVSDAVHRTTEYGPVKDLPLGPQQVELTVRLPQFHCRRCDRFFTPRYAAFAPGAHATERFLEHAARLIRFSDIRNAAIFLDVPEKTLERWYYDYVERLHNSPPPELKPILSAGIDELSLKKSTGSSSP
jgi:transposase